MYLVHEDKKDSGTTVFERRPLSKFLFVSKEPKPQKYVEQLSFYGFGAMILPYIWGPGNHMVVSQNKGTLI